LRWGYFAQAKAARRQRRTSRRWSGSASGGSSRLGPRATFAVLDRVREDSAAVTRG